LKKAGLQPIALVGGATGLIGDPSGRSEERPLISEQTVQNNVNQLHKFLKGVLGDDVKVR
jgi:tyrosyl-tRNA synthetase